MHAGIGECTCMFYRETGILAFENGNLQVLFQRSGVFLLLDQLTGGVQCKISVLIR